MTPRSEWNKQDNSIRRSDRRTENGMKKVFAWRAVGMTAVRVFGVRVLAILAALVLAGLPCGAQTAGTYPDKPVRIIVPFAPAGPTDVVARLIAAKLSERLGKQFYVENVAGAGGNMGMGQAARAAPDGYTVLFVSSSYVVNPSLYAKIPYDPYKDFEPVTVAGDAPNILLVHPSIPAKTVKELVDLIKANPGKYSFASAGTGTTPHLSGELFKLSLGLDLVHVPFGGAGPAIQSLAGGHTPIAFTSLPPAIPLIKDGKIRALAVSASKRVAVLPDVPTLTEAGLPDQEADTLQAVLVPAGTPKAVVDLLYREIKAIVALPDIKERFEALGLDPIANTPAEFAAQIRKEIPQWAKVIKGANIKID
jgi:tripartite-type tricarboxylate transporter receptor subunit TctC